MDCEKFETAMIDELYDELDELTSAAAKRHVAGCARCAALLGGLRATRRVVSTAGGIPLVDPPGNLEERILAAAREAQKVVPFRRKVTDAISAAGSWAMRPQTAMAAVFLLMIGSSVVFLKGGRKASSTASMTVTEQGAPAAAPMAQTPAEQSLDTPAANAAHGAAKKAGDPAVAASAVAMATATALPQDEAKGLMDGLTGGQGRGDKAGALGRFADDSENQNQLNQEEKLKTAKADNAAPRRSSAGPSNAGAIGGAYDSRAPYGGGGSGAGGGYPNAPPARPAPKPASAPGAGGDWGATPAPTAAAPPPAVAQAAPTTVATDTKDATKKEADRDGNADKSTTAFDAARAQLAQKNFAEATRQFDALAANGDNNAALWAARSVRDGSGCGAALNRYDAVAGRQAGTVNGNDALLEVGQCYRQLGQFETARARLVRLLTVPSHALRAQRELDAMSPKAAAKPQPRKAPEPSQQQAPPTKDSAF